MIDWNSFVPDVQVFINHSCFVFLEISSFSSSGLSLRTVANFVYCKVFDGFLFNGKPKIVTYDNTEHFIVYKKLQQLWKNIQRSTERLKEQCMYRWSEENGAFVMNGWWRPGSKVWKFLHSPSWACKSNFCWLIFNLVINAFRLNWFCWLIP